MVVIPTPPECDWVGDTFSPNNKNIFFFVNNEIEYMKQEKGSN